MGARKRTPFAAIIAMNNIAKDCFEKGVREAYIYIIGPGQGREPAIRRIYEIGIRIVLIRDITTLPHNGCRSSRKRHV